MWKRPAVVAPGFGQPATYNPITGMHAPLGVPGIKSRVALMQVLEIHDDYLVCRGFDPEDNRFYNAVAVAKPYLLQKTPWDGRELQTPLGNVLYTYENDPADEADRITGDEGYGARKRKVEYTDGPNDGTSMTERLTPHYFIGDVISAVKPRSRLGDTPGTPTIVAETDEIDLEWGILYDESNKPIHWMDLNTAGRCWQGSVYHSPIYLYLEWVRQAGDTATGTHLARASSGYLLPTSARATVADYLGYDYDFSNSFVENLYDSAGTYDKPFLRLLRSGVWRYDIRSGSSTRYSGMDDVPVNPVTGHNILDPYYIPSIKVSGILRCQGAGEGIEGEYLSTGCGFSHTESALTRMLFSSGGDPASTSECNRRGIFIAKSGSMLKFNTYGEFHDGVTLDSAGTSISVSCTLILEWLSPWNSDSYLWRQ